MKTHNLNLTMKTKGYAERMLSLLGYGAATKTSDTRLTAQEKTFISFFLPSPPHGELVRDAWGASDVGPRDTRNGLEDTTMKHYCYWDGQILKAPDGNFEFVPRDGRILFSDKGILGPYKPQSSSVFPAGIPNLEDPCIWYSGGLYHIVVNSWSTRKAYHLTSHDGIHDWTNRGAAYVFQHLNSSNLPSGRSMYRQGRSTEHDRAWSS